MAELKTGRGAIDLPTEVSSEIIQKTQESSSVMQLSRSITLPGRGITIPVIAGDPEPAWVNETEKKKVADPQLSTKKMTAYKMAVIVPFSMEFRRDNSALYNALVNRLPLKLAELFDATVFGKVEKPGENFDQLSSAAAYDISKNTYDGLVAADTAIAVAGYASNGYVISPQGKGILLGAKDTTGRPLFINSVAEGAVPMILGTTTMQTKGAYVAKGSSTPEIVGAVGDWTQAVVGNVSGIQVSVSDQATLDTSAGTINLWQQNMFAVRAEIELGFRCNTEAFARLANGTAA